MKSEFYYVINQFKNSYGIKEQIFISYIDYKENSRLFIKKTKTDFFKSNEIKPKNIVWKVWKGTKIPFLFEKMDSSIFL